MVRLAYSASRPSVPEGNTPTIYFSDLFLSNCGSPAVMRFLTYSSSQHHVRLVAAAPRMQEYLRACQENPDSGDKLNYPGYLQPTWLDNDRIEDIVSRYEAWSAQYGLNVLIVRHSAVPPFYEAHFTITDSAQLNLALTSPEQDRRIRSVSVDDTLAQINLALVGPDDTQHNPAKKDLKQLLTTAVNRMTFKTSRHY